MRRRLALASLCAAVLFAVFPLGSPGAVAAPYSSGETVARDVVFELPATGPGTLGRSAAVPQALFVDEDGTLVDAIGSTGLPTLSFTSQVIDAGQLFDRVGAWWTGADTEAGESGVIEVRASADGRTWGEWQLLKQQHDLDDEAAATFYSLPRTVAASRYAQYRIWLLDEDTTAIRRVGLTFLDVTDLNAGPLARLGNDLRTALDAMTRPYADAAPVGASKILSRRDWGADETRMRWTPQYKRPHTKAVVHHTVTADGGSNVAAEMRSIYYFHAVTRGWGDIGYQYLVDKYGNIWTGRQGGDHVEAGHAYGWNNGAFSVSAIGDYSVTPPTSALQGAIANIIAMKFKQYGIAPFGADAFIHQEQRRDGSWFDVVSSPPNIIGHRDANYVAGQNGGQTACPGNTIANMMEGLRRMTQAAYDNGYTNLFRLDPSLPRGTFPGATHSVPVLVANRGTNPIPAGTAVSYQIITPAGAGIVPMGGRATLTAPVAPNATSMVSVPFSGPPAGSYIVRWDLHNGVGWWNNTVGTPVRDQWIFSRDWGADWLSDTVPSSFLAGETRVVQANLLNAGGRPWPSTGTNPVKVGYSWRNVATGAILQGTRASLPSDVQPGQSVTVSVPVTAPTTPASYVLRLDLVKENEFSFGDRGIAPDDTTTAVLIDPKATFAIGAVPPLSSGQTVAVPVTVTNTGKGIFAAAGANPVTLGYHWYDAQGRTVLYDSPRALLPADLAPGATVALTAQVTAPAMGGTFTLKFDLVQEGVAWLSTRGLPTADRQVSVAGPIVKSYGVVYQPQVTSLATTGAMTGIPITLVNNSNFTWPSGGANPIRLSYHWWSLTTNRTVLWEGQRTLLQSDLEPGGSVSLRGNVTFPTAAGTYLLRWDLVEEGVQWFSGRGVPTGDQFVRVEIPKPFTYGSSMLPSTPARMALGATTPVPVRVQNLGQTTWDATVNLSYHWLDAAGKAVVWEGLRTSLDGTAPGALKDVTASVMAPAAAGTYTLVWDIVREGHAWFSGQGVQMPRATVEASASVAPPPPPPPAPGTKLTYSATYAPQVQAVVAAPGATATVPLMLVNSGSAWQSGLINASYHLVDAASGAMVTWDGARTSMPAVGTNSMATVQLQVKAPALRGTYAIRIDLVHEGIAWFSSEGVPMASVTLTVQ